MESKTNSPPDREYRTVEIVIKGPGAREKRNTRNQNYHGKVTGSRKLYGSRNGYPGPRKKKNPLKNGVPPRFSRVKKKRGFKPRGFKPPGGVKNPGKNF